MFVLTKTKEALIREILMNKYRLSDKVRLFHYERRTGLNLQQIVALRDFADVLEPGSEGGWLDDEGGADQAGTCWIYDPQQRGVCRCAGSR